MKLDKCEVYKRRIKAWISREWRLNRRVIIAKSRLNYCYSLQIPWFSKSTVRVESFISFWNPGNVQQIYDPISPTHSCSTKPSGTLLRRECGRKSRFMQHRWSGLMHCLGVVPMEAKTEDVCYQTRDGPCWQQDGWSPGWQKEIRLRDCASLR